MENRSMLVLRHTNSGETWNLSAGRLIVARKDALAQLQLQAGDAPLALDDPLVSRRHAVIRVDIGRFWITDEGSTDGTYVNDRQIHETTPITDGDRLRFGDSVLIGAIEPSTPSASPPRLVAADATVQYTPAALHARHVEQERTVFQPQPPVSRPPIETPALFSPVPTGTTTQPRTSQLPSAQVAPAQAAAIPAPTTAAPVTPPARAREEARTATPRARLEDVVSVLRQLERQAGSAVDRFEQAGGEPALQSLLALCARLQGSVVDREDIDALLKQLPTLCRLLEVEQDLIDIVSVQTSHAPR